MFTSGRSEMVTRIVGDINTTLVRKLEDLEHRVLMRIENLQRYEEATMGALTSRIDALERASASQRFQNEMIQDELDELERLLLREYAKEEVTRTISSSCQNLSPRGNHKRQANMANFAQKFGKRIFEKQHKKSQNMQRFTSTFAKKVADERTDVLVKAASIAKTCGSPSMVNNKSKLLKALVLHMAGRICAEQKKDIQMAKAAKSKGCSVQQRVENMNRLNAEFTKGFVKKYMDRTSGDQRSPSPRHNRSPPPRHNRGSPPRHARVSPAPRNSTKSPGRSRRARCYSDHGSIYDLNQYAYPSCFAHPMRLYSRPLQRISPEPDALKFNANVQRRPWSSYSGRAKSASPEPRPRGATYRFPAIKMYGNLRKSKEDLIDLNNNMNT